MDTFITESDMKRIAEFAAMPEYRRTPDMLRPDSESEFRPDSESE